LTHMTSRWRVSGLMSVRKARGICVTSWDRTRWGMWASGSALQMTAVGAEDISGPVHIRQKNGTVLDVASFEKSFELGEWGAASAMEDNAC